MAIHNFLVVGDWHLRGNNPRNRIDDYPTAAREKLREVFKLAVEHGAKAIIQPGDIFDRPEVSIAVLLEYAEILKESPVDIICTLGNHDIYGYNTDSYYRTSLRLLEMLVPQLRVIRSESDEPIYIQDPHGNHVAITATPYSRNMDVDGYGYQPYVAIASGCVNIHIAHGMLLDHKPPFDRYSDLYKVDTTAQVVITGHDHIGYGIYNRKADGVLFINPGSLLRISASVGEMERKPRVAILSVDTIKKDYNADFIELEAAKPGEEVLDRTAIEEAKERQYAMEAFSTLIQGHTGGKVLMDINQIIDQIAQEEQFAPQVVQTALQILDVQRERVAVNG